MRKNITLLTLIGIVLPAASLKAEGEVDFATQIYPFLKSGCMKCHSPAYTDERGRTRKPKADIVLSSVKAITEAVYEVEEEVEAPILVPGKPEETRMLQVTHLPLDDDMHFPPEGKAPQWTEAEKELFAKWVEEGANFGEWVEDPAPREGIEWDGVEKEPGTLETFDDSKKSTDDEADADDELSPFGDDASDPFGEPEE